MKIANEQKKQFIALCCLVVFVFAYGIIKLAGSGSQAQTRQTEAVTKPAEKSTEQAAPAEVEKPAAVVAAVDSTAGLTARDPFIPQVNTEASAQSPTRPRPLPTFPTLTGVGGVKPGISPLLLPDMQRTITVTSGGSAGQQSEQEDPSQVYKLTGVIQGSVNVAILRGPDNARYIVREGQVIDGKYQVTRVTRFGVSLSYNKRSYLLSLGGK